VAPLQLKAQAAQRSVARCGRTAAATGLQTTPLALALAIPSAKAHGGSLRGPAAPSGAALQDAIGKRSNSQFQRTVQVTLIITG